MQDSKYNTIQLFFTAIKNFIKNEFNTISSHNENRFAYNALDQPAIHLLHSLLFWFCGLKRKSATGRSVIMPQISVKARDCLSKLAILSFHKKYESFRPALADK